MVNIATTLRFMPIKFQSPEYEEAVKLRLLVLRKPLGLSFTTKDLEHEKHELHFAAFVHDKMVATLIFVPEALGCKMRQVAVHPDYQRLGIGARFLVFVENEAQAKGFNYVYCHARDGAVDFYLQNGYETNGDYFLEVGIPHVKMSKTLPVSPSICY